MSDEAREVLEALRSHPGRAIARTQMTSATFLCGLAAFAGLLGAPLVAVPLTLVGAIFAWSAWDLQRSLRGMVLVNRAYAAIACGDRELANALLDRPEVARAGTQFRRLAAYHRATLALAAADPREAIAQGTRALAEPIGLLTHDASKAVAVLASSQRALARAMVHDDDAALADAAATSDERFMTPQAMAYAELARALVASHRDQKDEVRAILKRAAPYFEDLTSREWELVRRLDRFATTDKRTIYRHPAGAHEDEIASLIASPAERKAEQMAPPAATTEPPPLTSKRARTSRPLLTLALWGALMVMFLAIWQALNPSGTRPLPTPTEPVPASSLFALFAAGFLVLFVALLANSIRVAQRARTARRIAVMRALGGDDAALSTLGKKAVTSSDAAFDLARLQETRGDFERALATCDQGIARASATRTTRMMTHDVVLPGLHAERAFCFAALGKTDEATAVLAAIPNVKTYPFAPSAQLRVRLAIALARGDRAAALEIARKRGDTMALPRRDAFLIDLLEATEGRGASDAEWARLHAQLAADATLAKWIDRFMPERTMNRRVATAEPLEDEELGDTAEAAEQS